MATRTRSFARLFAVRDFAVLWVAGTQSQLGDQLARVALSVLVYERTGSGLATAATYSLTYLPAVLGGIFLTGLADTLPRRGLLVACDVARAVFFAAMAIPGAPLWAICCLLVVAVLAGSPYEAAEPALVVDLFHGEDYIAANGLRTASAQGAQLVGFALGGVIVALTGAREALVIDAVTFAVSAVVLRVGLGQLAAAKATVEGGLLQIRKGFRTVAASRELRKLLGLSWLVGFWVVPEGLAAPYAAAHGGGATSVGMLLAAISIGNVVGIVILTRWVPHEMRGRFLAVLPVLTGVPLILCAGEPGSAVAGVLWGISGVFAAYLILVMTEYARLAPTHARGQAIGLASSGLIAAQGVGLLVGGAIASLWGTAAAIAIAGGTGSACAAWLVSVHRPRVAVDKPSGA